MRQFTVEEINAYLEYFEGNVIPLQEVLGRCFICGEPLDKVELPNGVEKKIVCLKDLDYFIESFEEFVHENNEVNYEPEYLKEDDYCLMPGEVILLNWCHGKNTENKIPSYFNERYAVVDVLESIEKLLDKKYLAFGDYHEQLNSLTVSKLSEILKNYKIKSHGRKKELVRRILDNEIYVLNIPNVYMLTNEGKQITEYNNHIISAHKDKYFPVYMAVRYREEFPYPTRYEDLKLGVLDIKIEEYIENNMIFQLIECFKVKGKHLEDYNKDYEQALVYALFPVLVSLYDITRIIHFGVNRISYNDIDRLITSGSIEKDQFDYLFDQALILCDLVGYDLDLIDSDEMKYFRELIYNIDYINTQKYIKKFISAEFFIEDSSVNHYMFISDIVKY